LRRFDILEKQERHIGDHVPVQVLSDVKQVADTNEDLNRLRK